METREEQRNRAAVGSRLREPALPTHSKISGPSHVVLQALQVLSPVAQAQKQAATCCRFHILRCFPRKSHLMKLQDNGLNRDSSLVFHTDIFLRRMKGRTPSYLNQVSRLEAAQLDPRPLPPGPTGLPGWGLPQAGTGGPGLTQDFAKKGLSV